MLFESVADNGLFMTPAPAMRVNRHNASHTLLVGDQEKTNFEMNEWLSEEAESRRDRTWWIIAIVLGAIALGSLPGSSIRADGPSAISNIYNP